MGDSIIEILNLRVPLSSGIGATDLKADIGRTANFEGRQTETRPEMVSELGFGERTRRRDELSDRSPVRLHRVRIHDLN